MSKAKHPDAAGRAPEPEPVAPPVAPKAPDSTPSAPPTPPAPTPPAPALPGRLCSSADRAVPGLKRFKVYGARPRVYVLAPGADEARALYGDGCTLVVALPD